VIERRPLNALSKFVRWPLIALAATFALAVALVLYDISQTPNYDDVDPRFAVFVERFAESVTRLTVETTRPKHNLDLEGLNGGNWTTACVFGGYNNPLKEMIALGANVSSKDRDRLITLGSMGFRIAEIEEFEIMIAYIDSSNDAHFMLFRQGVGSLGQHFRQCISKPETLLELP